jgi:hypothetical protein
MNWADATRANLREEKTGDVHMSSYKIPLNATKLTIAEYMPMSGVG